MLTHSYTLPSFASNPSSFLFFILPSSFPIIHSFSLLHQPVPAPDPLLNCPLHHHHYSSPPSSIPSSPSAHFSLVPPISIITSLIGILHIARRSQTMCSRSKTPRGTLRRFEGEEVLQGFGRVHECCEWEIFRSIVAIGDNAWGRTRLHRERKGRTEGSLASGAP